MSATYFVQYGSLYVDFYPTVRLVDSEDSATPFTSEADAWAAANANALDPARCEVVAQKQEAA